MEIKQQDLTPELKKQIYKGFSAHAIQMTGHDEMHDPLAFVASEGESLVGAIVVVPFWGALHIKYIYIDEKYRGKGLGTRLMQRAFAFGLQQKYPFAFVETMSFQALEFYQKMGFELDFTRPGYAHGTSFHYLTKKFPRLE